MLGRGVMTAAMVKAFERFDAEVIDAVNTALMSGVPVGLIVALLHGHAHQQTAAMMNG